MLDLNEIELGTRADAEAVLDSLYKLLSNYEVVTVGDYLELVGLSSSYDDARFGWTDLRGTKINRTTSAGYVLDLPEPKALNPNLRGTYMFDSKYERGMTAKQHAALRDVIRRDAARGLSHADIAQKHDLTIPSVNVALKNDEIVLHYVHLTQLQTGVMASIKVLVPRGTSLQEIQENWKAF